MGCDVPASSSRVVSMLFQSTHPSGVRPWIRVGSACSTDDFNPRTPVGCDGGSETVDSGRDEFQSTHPSGVRHLEGRRHSHPIDFNPRTPVGCDLSPPLIRRCRRYFNPRTPVGCDSCCGKERSRHQISIHAPQWGATSAVSTPLAILEFQSTHPSGVRLG